MRTQQGSPFEQSARGVLQDNSSSTSRMLTLTHPVQLVLKETMQETLHDRHTSISISGRPTCNLLFAVDIDVMGSSSGESKRLYQQIRRQSSGIWNGTEKSKIMTISTNNISAEISMNS